MLACGDRSRRSGKDSSETISSSPCPNVVRNSGDRRLKSVEPSSSMCMVVGFERDKLGSSSSWVIVGCNGKEDEFESVEINSSSSLVIVERNSKEGGFETSSSSCGILVP